VPSAWRLTKTKHLSTAWDGEGARRLGGRWNSVGTAVVYVSATLSLALAEVLVHLPGGVLPAFTAIPIEFGESLVTVLAPRDLPADWNRTPPAPSTQTIGDKWVMAAGSALLKVPSVVVPQEFNYVINPRHADFARVRIGTPLPFPFDSRLRRP
jgi:RES domain-containing protein